MIPPPTGTDWERSAEEDYRVHSDAWAWIRRAVAAEAECEKLNEKLDSVWRLLKQAMKESQ